MNVKELSAESLYNSEGSSFYYQHRKGGIIMRKSVKRKYEYKRAYDYDDRCDSPTGSKYVKKRSHKRLRKQLQYLSINKDDCEVIK